MITKRIKKVRTKANADKYPKIRKMKADPAAYERYPISTTAAFWLVGLISILVGIYLLSLISTILGILFIIYVIGLELSIYREGCVSCHYYGKSCASRRGRIAARLFRRQDPRKFCERQVTWKNLLPTMLVSIIPIIAGVYIMLAISFSFSVLILTIIPILMWFIGNPLLYGKLVCLHCKQGRICCPANEFFGKKVD